MCSSFTADNIPVDAQIKLLSCTERTPLPSDLKSTSITNCKTLEMKVNQLQF